MIICDRAAQYDAWFNRQLCWAHVLRTFDFLAEVYGNLSLGAELAACARNLFKLNRAYRSREISVAIYRESAREGSGLRERLERVDRAPGAPFDSARFEIVVEPFDATEPQVYQGEELVSIRG